MERNEEVMPVEPPLPQLTEHRRLQGVGQTTPKTKLWVSVFFFVIGVLALYLFLITLRIGVFYHSANQGDGIFIGIVGFVSVICFAGSAITFGRWRRSRS